MRGKMKLNLGCGKDNLDGYLNCDINPKVNPDMILDFNQKLPFKENTFEEVRLSHSLEHTKNLGFTLSECFRVSQGKVEITVPSPRSPQYKREAHTHLFEIYGLRGRSHGFIPEFIQKILGNVIPTEYIIEIRKRKID